jgi:hypothetical protein
MNDPECLATLNVSHEVVTPALFTDENLLALVVCRMVNLSLEHGNSDGSSWTKHIRTGRHLVRRTFDAANKIRDLTFAAYSCNNLNTNLLGAGDPLGYTQREAENGLEFARKAQFRLVIAIITAQLQRCGRFVV